MRYSSIALLFLLLPFSTSAATFDMQLDPTSIAFVPSPVVIGQPTKIYATISNIGDADVEGVVVFYDNGTFIASKAFSARASATRPEDVWVSWTPKTPGNHAVRVSVVNDPEYRDAAPVNNEREQAVVADYDTDRDGILDTDDGDIDGDGLTNTEEGGAGTDPKKWDTDGDGVNDKNDAYPLDALRSVKEVPKPPTVVEKKPAPSPVPVVPVKAQEDVRRTEDSKTDRVAPQAAAAPAASALSDDARVSVGTATTSAETAVEPTGTVMIVPVDAADTDVPFKSDASPTSDDEGPDHLFWWLWGLSAVTLIAAGLFFWMARRSQGDQD